jgi:ferredoxin-NADP reductase
MHIGAAAKQIATFETTFKGKRQVAEGTYEFTFEKPVDLHFQAGQHVRMSLINPPETDAEGDKRFFTMASTPQDADLVFAWRVRDTAFKRIMQNMQPGSKVVVQKRLGEAPQGSFVLHEDATKPAVFIAGGIGIIPAYAMVKDALQRGLTHKMYVFYSNRRPEDASYLADLQAITKKNPNVTLIGTMTEPEKSAQPWQGETGFINRAMIEKYVSDTSQPIYYVSGLLGMVDAMRGVLSEMNISKDNIRAEEFDGFKMGEGAHGSAAPSGNKNHLLIGVLALVIIAMVIVHVKGISHADITKLSFDNPLSYLVILAVLVIIGFKVFAIMKFKRLMTAKQPSQKASLHDIVEAHKPTRER